MFCLYAESFSNENSKEKPTLISKMQMPGETRWYVSPHTPHNVN